MIQQPVIFGNIFRLTSIYQDQKKLVSTHFEADRPSYKLEIIRQDDKVGQLSFLPDYVLTPLTGDWNFRSLEAIQLLKESNTAVTNPPFGLFADFISQFRKFHKYFLVIGNLNEC